MPRPPQVSPLVSSLSDRVFSVLADYASARGKTCSPLHVGDTYLQPLAAAQAECQRTAEHPGLHNYAPPHGMPCLLAAAQRKIARRSNVDTPTEAIQVMSGATSGLGVVCSVLLSPGDEVLLPSPYWPLIRGIIASRGATPVEVPLFHRHAESDFDPVGPLAAAITNRTVAIYLNSPHNPTGAILNTEQLESIGKLAERHNLWIISDEVYEDLAFDTSPRSMFTLRQFQGRVISTHSVSKAYGLAGARVGYTHGPVAVMSAIRAAQTFYTYCAPKPLQIGAAAALDGGDDWLRQARGKYSIAASKAAAVLGVPTPRAGTFIFFDCRPHFRDGEDIHGLLRRCVDAGLMLTPGQACGRDFEDWARLCFTVVGPDDLDRALEALRTVLTPSLSP